MAVNCWERSQERINCGSQKGFIQKILNAAV